MREINRENYQAFLLDRQENNLSPEREQELETFFKDNPDLLSEEEDCDLAFRLKEFPNDVFVNKEKLFKKKAIKTTFFQYGSAAALLLLAICTYFFVRQGLDNNKTTPLTKTLNKNKPALKTDTKPLDTKQQHIHSELNHALGVENEIVFDTLYLVREDVDNEDEEQYKENRIYYEYIAIGYDDNMNVNKGIKTNKILTYEKDN